MCLLLSLWGNIAVVHAQNAKVTMKMDNANVKEVLAQIEKATDYIFLRSRLQSVSNLMPEVLHIHGLMII